MTLCLMGNSGWKGKGVGVGESLLISSPVVVVSPSSISSCSHSIMRGSRCHSRAEELVVVKLVALVVVVVIVNISVVVVIAVIVVAVVEVVTEATEVVVVSVVVAVQ